MSAAIPKTISGVTRVMKASASMGTRIQARMRDSASASSVPSTHATRAFSAATIRLVWSESRMSGLRSAAPNHLVEKPSQ
jgi:hypothetical protein